MRSLCMEAGVPITIQDSFGCQLMEAILEHIGHSTPARCLLGSWASQGYIENVYGETSIRFENGSLIAGGEPGLGVTVDDELLGEPVYEVS